MAITRRWFVYSGNDTLLEQQDITKWNVIPFFPSCTSNGNLLCAIYARPYPSNPNIPDMFTPKLLSYIIAANTYNQAQPQTGFFTKKYLYVKYG